MKRTLGLALMVSILAGCGEDLLRPRSVAPPELPAAAGIQAAEKTSYEALMTVLGVESPPEITFSGHGKVLHERGATPFGIIEGDLTATFTSNWNWDGVLNDGVRAGPSRGIATFVLTELFGEPVVGGFELRAHGRAGGPPPFHTGRYEGHGTGDLAGMKISGTYTLVALMPPRFRLEGQILDPNR